jgi:hypothetical protein
MGKRPVAILLSALLMASAALGREREAIRTDWAGFTRQVSERDLSGHSVRIRLSGGGEVKTKLLEVTADALAVRSKRDLSQWNSGDGKASIPRDQVASVRFGGRTGHARLIGALTGLGGGAAIGAGVATNLGIWEGPGLIFKPLIGAAFAVTGLVTGYFIGRAFSRPGPEFILDFGLPQGRSRN